MTVASIRTTSLRVRLLLLALVAVLPVILFATFVVVRMAEDRRGRELEDLVRRTETAAAAVDRALFGASRELATLAVDKDLQDDDLRGAYQEAVAFAAQSSIGESISLLTPDGRILFNTRHPFGTPLPPSGDLPGVAEVARSHALRISNLFVGGVEARPIVTVDVPVLRDDRVVYVLHMVIDPLRFVELLQVLGLGHERSAVVVDRDGVTIARTLDPVSSVGRQASAGLLRAVAEGRDGAFKTTLRDGTPVMSAYRRTHNGEWVVAVRMSLAAVEAQRTRFLALLLGGAGLILLVAAGLTWRLAGRLEQRLLEVGVLAGRLGAGQPVCPASTGIRELDAVGQSLARAATLIASREAALTRAGKVAKDALASKAKFFAAANHDLRQPVQSLFLFHATLANLLTADHPARRPLEYAERSLHALEMLLDGLRDVSRLDAGAVVPVMATVELDTLLRPLAEEYSLRAAEMGVALHHVPTRLRVRSDRALLERVVRNLLENAIRYTPRGGRVLLGCRRRGGHVRLKVADTGIGIPADQLGVIFEEFHQLGNPARDSALGLGLGLAIVRRSCDLLGHGISVASTVGKGSTFTVHLPRAEEDEALALG